MRTPSTFLHDLVGTLTKSEKRYIKVQAGSGAKDYIQLMDALIAQKVYDEAQLIEDNKGANFLKHLAVNKRYLYELVLKLLTQFGQKALEDKVLTKLTAAKILIKKGLFQAAQNELNKGQKLAERYEFFDLQVLVCGVQKQLMSSKQKSKKQTDDVIHHIFSIEANSLKQLQNTNEYWQLAQKVARFQMQFQKIQTEAQRQHLESLVQIPEFSNIEFATNFKSKLYYYQANATYQFILGQVKKAYETNRQFLDLLEANPRFLSLYPERYLATLNNMLIDSLVNEEYGVLKEGIDRLVMTLERPEFKSIKNIEVRVFRQRYLLLINRSLSQQNFEEALEWIPKIEAGLEKFGEKIEKYHRVSFHYLIAYLLFLNGRFDQALKWNNLILNDPKEDVVKEIFYFSRVLNLLIHFELGNHTLLESLLISTPKYLKSRRPIYATEKTLIRFIGKLLSAADKTAKQKLITSFELEIKMLFNSLSEQRVFNYLDLRLWQVK